MIVKSSEIPEIKFQAEKLTASFVKTDGSFITKAFDIAKHFSNFFVDKIRKCRHKMQTINAEPSYSCITNKIMKDKDCRFEFRKVRAEDMKKY